MLRLTSVAGLVLSVLLLAGSAAAQDMGGIDTGDTTWILVCTALVMLMTPGLALFYGGLVRRKNVLSTVMQSFVMLALIGLQWVLWGYTLAFGPDRGGIIGGLDYLGLTGMDFTAPSDYAGTIPNLAFVMFQGMFAVITPALITGAFAERMRFSAFLLFSLLWATFVYDPLAHWVWGGGWLGELGALDFAGGLVVHISSGVAALAAALVVGVRRGRAQPTMSPHNLPLTVLGAALLWFGWFGFNAGSALAADATAALAFAVTHTATSAAVLVWIFLEWRVNGKPTVLGAATGAIAGLVAITPAAGFVGPLASIAVGGGAGLFCFLAVAVLKPRMGYDDSLDVFGVHGVGGIWGALATGIFASTLANPGGADGLLAGNVAQMGVQILSVLAAMAYAFILTLVLLKIVDVLVGLRVSEEDEVLGLDLSQHRESGYTILD